MKEYYLTKEKIDAFASMLYQAEKSKDSINKLKESIVETKGVLLNSQDILGQRGDKVNLLYKKLIYLEWIQIPILKMLIN